MPPSHLFADPSKRRARIWVGRHRRATEADAEANPLQARIASALRPAIDPMPDFAESYEDHVWRVYGYLAYRLHSRSEAEDLTQETFERALKAWGRYDQRKASVATWLLAIARNILI